MTADTVLDFMGFTRKERRHLRWIISALITAMILAFVLVDHLGGDRSWPSAEKEQAADPYERLSEAILRLK